MTDDLVQRLREKVGPAGMMWVDPLKAEAADRIEALEASTEALQARIDALMPRLDEVVEMGNRIEAFEAALREIARPSASSHPHVGILQAIARRVLEEKS